MSAWVALRVEDFLERDARTVAAMLSAHAASTGFEVTPHAFGSWTKSIEILKEALELVGSEKSISDWGLLLEYEIPRRAVRPDAVILAGDKVFVVEFKVGAERFDRSSLLQAVEYALDIRDFHKESMGHSVVPVLLATNASGELRKVQVEGSQLRVMCANSSHQLSQGILAHTESLGKQIELNEWDRSAYQPTPDILTAARTVFAGNEVREISFAYADNLTKTVNEVRNAIAVARRDSEHVVIFVTGVPGSGKTLAGLSAVHKISKQEEEGSEPLGAYLSGNGPLVDVLRYALSKDVRVREGLSREEAERRSKTFIQPVHLYIREYSDPTKTPPDRVIVFDEAQRAWNAHQMMKKQGINASEAEIILDAMGRISPWSVVVALVGEGQEINSGEAGLEEWVKALEVRTAWKILVAPDVAPRFRHIGKRVSESESMHLSVNVRSPRARAIADWAHALVNGELTRAAEIVSEFPEYPILVTRSLEEMRQYLRDRVFQDSGHADRRIGLLASSQARRLRPFGIEMSNDFQGGIEWPNWFVDEPGDVRSSFQLEVAASEFKCQGLEIDWAGLCWGDDFVWDVISEHWKSKRLRGSKWVIDSDKTFAENRYRVLLTRARFGLVIWIPRPRGFELLVDAEGLDRTEEALLRAGAKRLENLV